MEDTKVLTEEECFLIQLATQTIMKNIEILAVAKYGRQWNVIDHTLLMRNVLLNVHCNFINEHTSQEIAGALDRNIKETCQDIQNWFKEMKKHNNKKDTH